MIRGIKQILRLALKRTLSQKDSKNIADKFHYPNRFNKRSQRPNPWGVPQHFRLFNLERLVIFIRK